ncbi:alpha-ribazole phosphatase [Dethiothermospora halolimnae]|uniref:alpha-ribazole phosphatase n=1 Tax=Dethiothermospora halolimnae TaxID=3114390 RepID=UPI003CCBC398
MKLILLRHGETMANKNKRYSGWTDYDLTEKGKKQVDAGIEKIIGEDIDYIYSSPLKRTLYTANIIGSKFNKEVKVDNRLKELNFGIFEGKTYKEIRNEYKEESKRWIDDYVNYRIPEGESLMDVHSRIANFLGEIKNTDKTYVVVTHSGVIGVILTTLLDLKLEKMWNFKIDPGCVVKMEYNDGFGVLLI